MKRIPHRMTRNRLRRWTLDTHPEVDIHPQKLDQKLTPRSNHPVTHPVLVTHPDRPDILQNRQVPVTRREALAILQRLDIRREARPVIHHNLNILRKALQVIHQSLATLREALIHQDPVTHLVARILHQIQGDIHRPPSMRKV